MDAPMSPGGRSPLVRPRRVRSHTVLAVGLKPLLAVVLLRGFGPYSLTLTPAECASNRAVICTNHTTYRTLEHVLVTVTNRTGAAFVVERDHDTGSVVLT